MRLALALSLLVAPVLAAPLAEAAPRVTWADWVGAYSGRLAWSSACTIAGEARATLAIEATDGVLAIELAPARPGLRALSLVEGEAGLEGQQGDTRVAVRRSAADTVDVTVVLDSGCTMKARLARARSGVAACDRLAAWSRVEARCTKLGDAARLENAAKLAAARWKATDAKVCAARADALERALVDAGCAPHPDPQLGVRARACLDLVHETAALARCGAVPHDLRDGLSDEARRLAAAAQTADDATRPYVERECRSSRTAVATLAAKYRCP